MWYAGRFKNPKAIRRGRNVLYQATENSPPVIGTVMGFRVVDGKYLYRVTSNPAVPSLEIETEYVRIRGVNRNRHIDDIPF